MKLTGEQPSDIQVGGAEEDKDPIAKPVAADVKPVDAKPVDVKPVDVDATVDELETITINPDLDETLLQSLVNTTRKLIVELYVACENDFLEGITLFESIVAVQLAKTTASQIKLLNDISLEYLDEHQI